MPVQLIAAILFVEFGHHLVVLILFSRAIATSRLRVFGVTIRIPNSNIQHNGLQTVFLGILDA